MNDDFKYGYAWEKGRAGCMDGNATDDTECSHLNQFRMVHACFPSRGLAVNLCHILESVCVSGYLHDLQTVIL